MQRRQRDHVLVLLALADGGQQRDGLRHFQQALLLAGDRSRRRRRRSAPPQRLRHPVAELQHVGPARGRDLLAVLAVVQVLLVVDVLEPLGQEGAVRPRRRWCGGRGTPGRSRSGRTRAGCPWRARSARCASEDENSASNRLSLYWLANVPRLASVWWPMPRLGVVTARRNAGSSSLLTHRRSQAHRSLISARSKKLWPPDTLYGICALRSACSKIARLVVGAVQHREVLPAPCAQRRLRRGCDWMRATDALGLVLLVVGIDDAHRLAFAQFGEQRLRETAWGWAGSRCWPRAGWRWWSGSSAPA